MFRIFLTLTVHMYAVFMLITRYNYYKFFVISLQLTKYGVITNNFAIFLKHTAQVFYIFQLKVVGAPDDAVRLSKIDHIMEAHKNYALTFDNMLKMIAIYFRYILFFVFLRYGGISPSQSPKMFFIIKGVLDVEMNSTKTSKFSLNS